AALTSGGPGELRPGEGRLALVLDAEGIDARAGRLRDRQLGPGGMEDPDEPCRLSRLDAERHDVLDLEVDRVPDLDAVAETVLLDVDRGTLDSEALADERTERLHRAAELPAEDGAELRRLLVRGLRVDEDAEAPVSVGHHLGRIRDRSHLETAHVGALDLAVDDVEDQRHATAVVVGTERERCRARAHDLARAGLEIRSLETPGHCQPPFRRERSARRFSVAAISPVKS